MLARHANATTSDRPGRISRCRLKICWWRSNSIGRDETTISRHSSFRLRLFSPCSAPGTLFSQLPFYSDVYFLPKEEIEKALSFPVSARGNTGCRNYTRHPVSFTTCYPIGWWAVKSRIAKIAQNLDNCISFARKELRALISEGRTPGLQDRRPFQINWHFNDPPVLPGMVAGSRHHKANRVVHRHSPSPDRVIVKGLTTLERRGNRPAWRWFAHPGPLTGSWYRLSIAELRSTRCVRRRGPDRAGGLRDTRRRLPGSDSGWPTPGPSPSARRRCPGKPAAPG